MLPFEINRRTEGQIKFDRLCVMEHFFKRIFPSLAVVIVLHYFVQTAVVRISGSVLVLVIYLFLSYRNLGAEVKKQLVEFIPILNRAG
jgi:hypothetical protein